MNDVTQLVLTSGLVFLLGFLVLVFPLIFMLAGNLLPWLEKMATQRQAEAGVLSVRQAPLARRTAAGRSGTTARRKVAVTRANGAKAPARKTAKKKAAPKSAGSKSGTARKKAAAKKPAAPKTAAATKKTATTKKVARKKAAPPGAKKDPDLGRVYAKKPAKADDLKKISGVGKVLETKLHAEGIYTYRQIADWTPKQMATLGDRLSFKGRIERDGWKRQAKALHKAKYDEAL